MEKREGDAVAAHPDGVAEGECATVDVHDNGVDEFSLQANHVHPARLLQRRIARLPNPSGMYQKHTTDRLQ